MTNAATRGSAPPGSRAWLQGTAFIVIGLLALYFYAEYATRYFVWSEESYGAYFWGKRVALAFHPFGGTLALTMGLPQLWMGFRNRLMNVHRWTGRLYVVGVLVGSIGAITMALAPERSLGWGFAFALFALAIGWIVTTATAYFTIRRRKVQLHKEWMIRSYVVTLAFVTFRILSDWVPFQTWGLEVAEYNTAMMWACWVFPLLAAEIAMQWRDI